MTGSVVSLLYLPEAAAGAGSPPTNGRGALLLDRLLLPALCLCVVEGREFRHSRSKQLLSLRSSEEAKGAGASPAVINGIGNDRDRDGQ